MSKPALQDAFSGTVCRDDVTGVVLAGGLGKRMGYRDKGLQLVDGKPMVQHVLERLAPQTGHVMINANRHFAAYAAYGFPVYADEPLTFAGPLAGFLTGLRHCATPFLVTVPCDVPFIPVCLVNKLYRCREEEQADLAIAATRINDSVLIHPVFCLMKTAVLPHLIQFLESGDRKIDRWYTTLKRVTVCFPDPVAFENVNTPDDLKKLDVLPPDNVNRLP